MLKIPLPFEAPLVMGILNVTPDSFSDGGSFLSVDKAVKEAAYQLENGAAILDIGGESTRPKGKAYGKGAVQVSAETEKSRILPVIQAILQAFPKAILSVDTYKPHTAKAALDAGVKMLNDVTGLRLGTEMATLAKRYEVPLCLMHSVGKVGDMPHILESEQIDIVSQVKSALNHSIQQAKSVGLDDLILDVGFGFGKSPQDNLRLLNQQEQFLDLGYPLLVGISRKSTIGVYLGETNTPKPVEERLFGTLGATAIAVIKGASVVRTHDVKETTEFLTLLHKTRMA